MRDPDRIPEVLSMLERLWQRVPDWRLCQVISNAADGGDVFYCEDDDLVVGLRRLIEENHR